MLDSAFIKAAAREAGFDLSGVARAEPLDPGPLDRVLEVGAEADMTWLRTQREMRLDPTALLPGAKSVVALALRYASAEPDAPAEPGQGRVARYARGRDYHRVVERRLRALTAQIQARDADAKFFASVDIAPVMEKAWAQRAGLGWVGKNGLLITPEFGSFVFLATVLIDRELEPDAPHPNRCGACEACMPACPTGAITAPGFVDARRCIAFQTIERRGPVPALVAERLGEWVFGCDDCQTVCPWNRSLPPLVPAEGLAPVRDQLELGALLALTVPDYQARYYGTALARARYDGLVRNAILAVGYQRRREHLPAVRRHLESELEGVRAAAQWTVAALAEVG